MAGFDIPDNDVAFNANQSIWMSTDIDTLTAGYAGVGVVSGCGVTAQGSPDMTVAVAAGIVRIANGSLVAVSSGNATINTADGSNPRIDLVSVSDTGTKTVTDGTAAANPKPPAIPSGNIPLAMVYVPSSDTTIASDQITDKRVLLAQWAKMGWQPFAWATGLGPGSTVGTAITLAANGGSMATPIILAGWMNLDSVVARNGDTGTQRTWGWDLYLQSATAANTLDRVAASSADETFTPSGAASTRTITAGSAPVILAPGTYWLVIQCRHASNNFRLDREAGGTMSGNIYQTKTTTNPNGSTLDFTAATWTKGGGAPGVRLQGRVFGESSFF